MAVSQEIPALKEIGGELALPPGRENGVRPQQPGESEVRNQDHTGEDLTIQGKGLTAHSPTMPGTQLGTGHQPSMANTMASSRSEEFDWQLGVRLGLPGSAGAKERVNPEVPE